LAAQSNVCAGNGKLFAFITAVAIIDFRTPLILGRALAIIGLRARREGSPVR
jgi:hypothetical protein